VITVHLEILSSLVDTLDTDSKSDTVILEQEIEEGITIRDILNRLSDKYQRLTEVVFDNPLNMIDIVDALKDRKVGG
jgi:DNA-directed RNA polymerase specialized sigma subunit